LLFIISFANIIQKILRTILKTKNYVEANGERLDKIESFFYNSTSHHTQNSYYVVETENICQVFSNSQ